MLEFFRRKTFCKEKYLIFSIIVDVLIASILLFNLIFVDTAINDIYQFVIYAMIPACTYITYIILKSLTEKIDIPTAKDLCKHKLYYKYSRVIRSLILVLLLLNGNFILVSFFTAVEVISAVNPKV